MYKRRIEQAAIDGLVQRALVTAARTYLEGGTFRDGNEVRYCGATADKQLLDDIEAEVADVPKDLLNQYTKCVFDMRFGRYFQRDLLAALVCVQPERFNRHLASFERVVQAWEQAGKMMSLFNQRNKLDKAATSRIIHALRAKRIFGSIHFCSMGLSR